MTRKKVPLGFQLLKMYKAFLKSIVCLLTVSILMDPVTAAGFSFALPAVPSTTGSFVPATSAVFAKEALSSAAKWNTTPYMFEDREVPARVYREVSRPPRSIGYRYRNFGYVVL